MQSTGVNGKPEHVWLVVNIYLAAALAVPADPLVMPAISMMQFISRRVGLVGVGLPKSIHV